MKNIKFNYLHVSFFISLVILCAISCSRDDEGLELATFSNNAEIFIDGFSGGLEYLPFAGSKLDAFTVDTDTKYRGSASMRFDIPNEGDPDGSYAGAIFPDNTGRDLSEYDALSFWAKGTVAGTINEIGFGNDFGENKYVVTLPNLQLTTNWRKYTVPIPDPSKLTRERGLFGYSEGPEDGKGYTFWVDDLQFEKLGTFGQPRPEIFGGEDLVMQTFIGIELPLTGLREIFNFPSGIDDTINIAHGYFDFSSSNPSVADVDESGLITVVGAGSTVISATLNGVAAIGSITLNSIGNFEFAPMPSQEPMDVISIFSNAYDDIAVDYYNGFWQFSSTEGGDELEINGDNIISYNNLNFVGIQFAVDVPTINASEMTHFHIDILVPDEISPGAFLRIGLNDIGPDNSFGGGDDSGQELSFSSPQLVAGEWVSLDIPLSDFTGLTNRSNLAQVIFVSDLTIPDILIDNIYLYKDEGGVIVPSEPTTAAPTPTQDAGSVISLFSDAYDDVAVDTWRTDWSSGGLEDVSIGGSAVKKYTNLDFVGIEAVSNTIDASGMTNFRMDVWSSDFTQFGVKIVDFGPNGVFDGGDDSEHQINIEMPAQGEWVSLDIPLADFTGLTTQGNIAQFIIVGQPSGATTVYVDNVYFYGSGGGIATEPTVAAPTPAQDAGSVLSLFSDAYEDVAVDTWRTDWSSGGLEDVSIGGSAVKKYTNLDFVGIEAVSNTIDASGMTNFRMDVWSSDFTQFGVKIVDFGPNGVFDGGDDTEHQINIEMPAQGEWVSLDIPLADFTGLTTQGNIAQFIIVGQPSGATTVYVDNVYFYGAGGSMATEPTTAAPTPTQAATDVVSLFSDAYEDVAVDTWRTDWSSGGLEDVSIGGSAVKKYTNLDFVGIETVSNTIDANGMTNFRMDVWSSDFTQFGVKIVDFGPNGVFDGGDDTEHQINIEMPAQGEWVSLDIPLADFTGLTTQGNIAQFIIVGQPTGATTVYVDNVYFYGSGGGIATEPTVAAPNPTLGQGQVISVFSDAYSDIAGTDLNPNWGQATAFSQMLIADDNTMFYGGLNYQGIALGSSQDVSGLSHLHLDMWTANSTALNVFLISAGGVETPYALSVPTSGWSSIDIPLGDFSPVDLANVIQLKFDGDGDIYLDNIYFYTNTISSEPSLPLTFENGETLIAFDDGATAINVDNPVMDGNSSAKVLEFNKVVGSAWYSGVVFDESLRTTPIIDLTNGTVFTIKIWSPKAGINVRFQLEGGAAPAYEVFQTVNTANQWETLTYDFTSQVNATDTYPRFSIFPDFDASNQVPVTEGVIYYIDDITQQ